MDPVKIIQQPIDLIGQDLSHKLYRIIITLAGIIGTIAGYITQDFQITMIIVLVGTTIAFLLCVPPWPFYNRNPLPFKLKPKPADGSSKAKRNK